MKRGIVPGTFDPVTSGHLDIIERAAALFDELVVGVALSPEKGGGPLFTVEERVALIETATAHLPNVSVRPFDTLLVDFAEEVGASVIVKGLRAVTDFEREFQMAAAELATRREGRDDVHHGHTGVHVPELVGGEGDRTARRVGAGPRARRRVRCARAQAERSPLGRTVSWTSWP